MRKIPVLVRIAFKSLLKRNRGNILLFICVFLFLIIPATQFNITNSIMNQVEVSQKRVFGNFTDIYYDDEKSDNLDISFSDSDIAKMMPGFNYEKYGVLSVVYQEKLNETKVLRVGFADETARKLGEITLLKGSFPAKAEEIALTESMAEAMGKQEPGDQIVIFDSPYTISGIILDFGHLWPQRDEQNYNNIGSLNAFVTEQEANRIYSQTAQLSRQILIARKLGASNSSENDSNLLRNINNSLENRSSFNVPNEFAVLMMITMMVSIYMILILNRKRLSKRIYIYHKQGLYKSDIRFIICFELIFLGLLGSFLGIAASCGISNLLLNSVSLFLGQKIQYFIDLKTTVALLLSALIGIVLLVLIYSSFAIRAALQENEVKVDRFSIAARKTRLISFVFKQNRRSLIALMTLVTLLFSLLSFGEFYARYFCSDVYEQAAGKLPKDYDCLFAVRGLPSIPLDNNKKSFYYTDHYEQLGADSAFIKNLESLPQVDAVKTYKEINKLCVLITEDQMDDYIDAHDYMLDNQYSATVQNGIIDIDFFRNKFGYQNQEILVGAEILTYPESVLKSLENSVVEGKIDLAKISSGDEIVLRVPAYEIRPLTDGGIMKAYVPYGQKGAYNSTTFHVGDEIHLSGIMTDEKINGFVVYDQADVFYRKDIIAKVGAIIRNTDGLFSTSGSFGKAFSVLTLDEALSIYGLDATYSNVSVYSKQGYSSEDISQAISSLSNQVPNMVFEDFQKEVQTYKIYKLMIDIYVSSLMIVLAFTALIIMSSQLLAKTKLKMKNFALLRICGLNFWRIVRLNIFQISIVVALGSILGIPVSLLLFWKFGTYTKFDVLQQIMFYFPLNNFSYTFAGIVILVVLSVIPSMVYLLMHKTDVLFDIN
ncbi:MAG: ABC transporter permease [Clostridiaceae bacterium]|nr:ABC transporter permease [Clostridiaceae bacterium]